MGLFLVEITFYPPIFETPMPQQNPEQARWFAEEVQPHGPALRAYLLGRFPSLPDIDNIVQESLVRVLRASESARIGSAKALLFTMARNLALDVMRRQKVATFEPITETPDSSVFIDGIDVVETINKKQELALLTHAIQSLPERCRQVLTLRTAYGLSQKEIAAKLEITENTVEKQMGKGILRCREYFAHHGLP